MKKHLLIITFIIFYTNSEAQNIQHNLEKYWHYRQRLKDEFIVVSSNNSKGTNLPAMTRGGSIDQNTGQFSEASLSFTDGNGGIQYYIGMLATEYRLLKDYGQDYSETLNELVFALRAVERLDLTAESYYRPTHNINSGDLNGFFIRDDIYSNFTNMYANGHNFRKPDGTPLDVSSCYLEDYRPMSQDNVWHYLLNFALVKRLVDDNQKFADASGQMVTVKEWVQQIANRFIRIMHPSSNPVLFPFPVPSTDCNWFVIAMGWCWDIIWVNPNVPDWQIRNPVTGILVPEGSTPTLTNAGFAEAGNWITENKYGDLNYPNSKLWWPLFVSTVALSHEAHVNTELLLDVFETYTTIPIEFARDAYGENALATVIGEPLFNDLIQWNSLYDHLRDLRYERYQTLGVTAYEHFALIDLVLHSSGSETNYYADQNIYSQLLDEAPDCGPFNYGINSADYPGFSINWASNSRLVWPENNYLEDPVGNFNGIDYMLLHNLYWLVYKDKIPYNYYVKTNFPVSFGGFGSDLVPAVILASNKVLGFNTLYSDAKVTYIAGNEVDLLPGFDSQTGSEFEAYTLGWGAENVLFQKINPNYNCSQKLVPVYKNVSDSLENRQNNEEELLNLYTVKQKVVFKIYPNPSNGLTNFYYSETEPATLEITDINGKLLYSTKILTHDFFTNLTFLQPGVFIVKLKTTDKIITEKLIIQY